MTTLEKIEKAESILNEVRLKVAGLGIISALLRDIKGDIIEAEAKNISPNLPVIGSDFASENKRNNNAMDVLKAGKKYLRNKGKNHLR